MIPADHLPDSKPTISMIPRFSGSSASLDYANRWRGQHMESAYHGDRKSCSTRIEISTPGRRYGCTNIADIVTPSAKELGITFRPDIGIAYVTTIRNRHSKTVDRALISQNSVSGPKFLHGACVLVHRLSYPLGRAWIFVRPAIRTARENSCTSWPTYRWWRMMRDMLHGNPYLISHVYREANQVADQLANHAISSMHNDVFWGADSFPFSCKGPVVLDKSGLMN
ncbi:hypothetical protein Taro_007537, partial [Colocasia esculenta]|nr:hypothetical protein [Colocasia esculenta]